MRLWVALRLAQEDGCQDTAASIIRDVVPAHLLGFPGDPLAAAAHRFELVLPRALMRVLALEGAEGLDRTVRKISAQWEPEVLLRFGGPFGLDTPRLALASVMSSCRNIWVSTSSWNADRYETAADALNVMAESLLEQLQEARHEKGRELLSAFAGGIFSHWLPEEDELVSYTVLALDASGDPSQLPPSAQQVVRATTRWAGSVASAATRLLARSSPMPP
jgi:hypothetical protein